jgi:ADP-ribose pyrophosphatase YjhB (NUDIX family)
MDSPIRDTYCSFCGARHAVVDHYPRTCPGCATQIWANPTPVTVVLVPVAHGSETGLLVVRRAIEPQLGKLSLVGGFLEAHETWQEGGAREVREESGVIVDPATLEPFWFASTAPRPNMVLLFSLAPGRDAAALEPFAPDAESSERGLVVGPDGLDDVVGFPTHRAAMRRFFAARGVTGPHAYRTI